MLAELPTLKKGDRSDRVEALQELLNRLRYGGLAVDGIFGPETERAVKAFQLRYGLHPDGMVGPLTLDRLQQASTSVSPLKSPLMTPSGQVIAASTTGGFLDKLKATGFSGFPIWLEVMSVGALIYAASVTGVIAHSGMKRVGD